MFLGCRDPKSGEKNTLPFEVHGAPCHNTVHTTRTLPPSYPGPSSFKMFGSIARTARADLKSSQLTLEHFLMRARTLSLYRKYLRATRDIPNPLARWETIHFFRDDVHRFRHETDLEKIKDLLVQGNRFLKQMQGQMTLAGAASDGNANKLRGTRQL